MIQNKHESDQQARDLQDPVISKVQCIKTFHNPVAAIATFTESASAHSIEDTDHARSSNDGAVDRRAQQGFETHTQSASSVLPFINALMEVAAGRQLANNMLAIDSRLHGSCLLMHAQVH